MRIALHAILRVAHAHPLQHPDGFVPGLAARHATAQNQRLDQLFAHAERRVERHHRLLEHHADAGAALRQPVARRLLQQVLAFEQRLSAGDARRIGQQAQQRLADQRLAAAGLTDEGQRFACEQIE